MLYSIVGTTYAALSVGSLQAHNSLFEWMLRNSTFLAFPLDKTIFHLWPVDTFKLFGDENKVSRKINSN